MAEDYENSRTTVTQQASVFEFVSRHFVPLSLSRYGRRWYLAYPRVYGLACGQRLICALNTPDDAVDASYASRHFWLNAWLHSQPYNPEKDGDKRFAESPIHLLLDALPRGIRLTGRMRTERSNCACPLHSHGRQRKEVVCYEVEVLIPDEGLLRQCYHCLGWETPDDLERRFKSCGEDVFWCEACEKRGWWGSSLKRTMFKIAARLDGSLSRENLYY